MNNKKIIAVVCGGKSPEHQVSLLSSQNILKNIDRDKYDVILIGISKMGRMFLYPENDYLENKDSAKDIALKESEEEICFLANQEDGRSIFNLKTKKRIKVDLVIPILHGENGEDGTIQGMFSFANIKYLSSSALPCALTMDKDFTKKVLTNAGIKNSKYLVFNIWEKGKIKFDEIKNKLGLPLFIKPARLGSSIGVSKVKNEEEFGKAINEAFNCDEKILIEEFIKGQEIECSVIGKKKIISSKVLGEVISNNEDGFYTYEAKYIDENGAILKIPAEIDGDKVEEIRNICEKAYKALGLDLFARVDGFLLENGEFFINEINAIPGFTNISMFPKLFQESGLSQKELISKLIEIKLGDY